MFEYIIMRKSKLTLTDFDIYDFKLIGIHSTLEPHKLVYLINSKLGINFKRMDKDLDLTSKTNTLSFPVFEYFNTQWEEKAYIISNVIKQKLTQKSSMSLFQEDSQVVSKYVLEDFKRINYIMKINDELNVFNPAIILKKLLSIQYISMAYSIDLDSIKHPEHLILD